MKTSDLVRQLKCIYVDKDLSEECRHKVVGTDHQLLVQQMIEHSEKKHGIKVDPKELESKVEPLKG